MELLYVPTHHQLMASVLRAQASCARSRVFPPYGGVPGTFYLRDYLVRMIHFRPSCHTELSLLHLTLSSHNGNRRRRLEWIFLCRYHDLGPLSDARQSGVV